MCIGRDLNTISTGRNSSLPKYKETLREKIIKAFSKQNELHYGSKVLNVKDIVQKQIFSIKDGDFLGSDKKHWNLQFEGEIQYRLYEGNNYAIKKAMISGLANVEDKEIIEVSNQISLNNE